MTSYEAIQKAIRGKTVDIARRLGTSTSLINKWQEPHADYTDSGALNPLDRIETIIEGSIANGAPTEDAYAPIYYLAERFGLAVIPLSAAAADTEALMHELTATIKEFGDLATEAGARLADGDVSRSDARAIDKETWELVRQAIAFNELTKRSVR